MLHSLLHPSVASFGQISPVMWVMMVPIAVFVTMGIVAIVGIVMKNLERERWHQTARLAMEKGLPVPNMPDSLNITDAWTPQIARPGRHRQRMGLITAGLINVAVGIGLYIGLSEIPGAWVARKFAFIPGLCGVALLMGAVIDALLSSKSPDPGDTSPKS